MLVYYNIFIKYKYIYIYNRNRSNTWSCNLYTYIYTIYTIDIIEIYSMYHSKNINYAHIPYNMYIYADNRTDHIYIYI